jgi:flagellar biogenesis protein FliO
VDWAQSLGLLRAIFFNVLFFIYIIRKIRQNARYFNDVMNGEGLFLGVYA